MSTALIVPVLKSLSLNFVELVGPTVSADAEAKMRSVLTAAGVPLKDDPALKAITDMAANLVTLQGFAESISKQVNDLSLQFSAQAVIEKEALINNWYLAVSNSLRPGTNMKLEEWNRLKSSNSEILAQVITTLPASAQVINDTLVNPNGLLQKGALSTFWVALAANQPDPMEAWATAKGIAIRYGVVLSKAFYLLMWAAGNRTSSESTTLVSQANAVLAYLKSWDANFDKQIPLTPRLFIQKMLAGSKGGTAPMSVQKFFIDCAASGNRGLSVYGQSVIRFSGVSGTNRANDASFKIVRDAGKLTYQLFTLSDSNQLSLGYGHQTDFRGPREIYFDYKSYGNKALRFRLALDKFKGEFFTIWGADSNSMPIKSIGRADIRSTSSQTVKDCLVEQDNQDDKQQTRLFTFTVA